MTSAFTIAMATTCVATSLLGDATWAYWARTGSLVFFIFGLMSYAVNVTIWAFTLLRGVTLLEAVVPFAAARVIGDIFVSYYGTAASARHLSARLVLALALAALAVLVTATSRD